MNNDIITLLNFNHKDVLIGTIRIEDTKKIVPVSMKRKEMYCPLCNFRLHSKGFKKRTVNHPILQDGYSLVIELKQRRWFCSNEFCDYKETEVFPFVEPYQHNTNLTPIMILRDLKDLSLSAAYIARKYNVSDTYVHNIVLRYLNPKRLELPRILAVDEVYLNFDNTNTYSLILMNWETGEIVDILPNRLISSYEDYFVHIPIEERNKVEYIVSDMYNPYLKFTEKYFRKASAVLDSFHISQWILNEINKYINSVKKRYQIRDNELLHKKNHNFNLQNKTIQTSKEVYILNRHRWVMLKNNSSINYSLKKRWDFKLKQYLNTYDYEKRFFSLDKNFEMIRDLKEKYIAFNSDFPINQQCANHKLEELIQCFHSCDIAMFRQFSYILKKHQKEIVNSFTNISFPKNGTYEDKLRRISNGPLEGYNRKPKDLKRLSRGFSNFDYTRNRILWSNRNNEPILGNPKSEKEVHTYTNIKRGSYKTKKID